ncbi:hypothetical protein V1477_006474 [Vespula maculifrons]|uniref:Uncharacterized protein n=1 Tax=Vespula maculifrons TaxID=7453 RepID=A0ABD2CIZ6_VESMC
MQSRDTRFRETTTKSGLGPTFTVTSSVELWTPTRELRNLRGCHPCKRLRETTTKLGLGPTFAVTSSVDFWTSTRELRQFSRMPSMQSRDSRLRETTTKSGLGPNFTVTSSVELWTSPRELRKSWDSRLRETTTNSGLGPTFPVTTSVVLWTSTKELRNFRGCHPCKYTRFRETTTKSGLGPTFTVTSSVVLWTSTRELRNFRRCHPCNRIRETTTKSGLDRPLKLLVQLCIGLRRENLEIFVDAIHGSISGQLIQIYGGIFGFRLKCRTQMQIRDTRFRETTTKYGLGPTFTVTSSVELWTPTRELRNLRGCHPCNRLRETTTMSGLGPTFTVTSSVELWTPTRELRNLRGCHPCNRLRETTTKSGLGPTFTVTSSVDFWTSTRELRQFSRMPSIEIKMLNRDSRLRETTTKSGLGPTLTVTSSVELWTSTRELRNFRGCLPCKLKCRLGILGFERRQQSTVLDRPLQLLVQLSIGLRQENLEIFADAIHAIGFERRQQSRVLDLPLQLLVQWIFGLRRENLEIFTDAIHASINEQLIQIYDGIFGFRLKCRVEILAFERGRQSRTQMQSRESRLRETTKNSGHGLTFPVTTSLDFGLRRENLEIFADAIHASINEQLIQIYDGIFGFILKCRVGILGFERRRQSRVLDRPLQLLVQLSCGLRQDNLEIFADAIHASINEQLIQIYNSFFDFSLKYRVGIVGFGRRQKIRVLD